MALLVNQLNKLRLDCLDHGWVKAIYDTEFMQFGDLPEEYENAIEFLDLQSTFQDIMKSTKMWLTQETESTEEKSWATLSHLIQQNKLLAILAYYINFGCKNVLIREFRGTAILASRVYYKLLSIPGFKAYDVYHSQLFAQSLKCLSFPKAMCGEENSSNTKDLTREVNMVLKELRYFVDDLRAIIEHLHLNPSDMNFEDIISNLVEVTGGAIVNKLHVDKLELTNMSRVIYEIIDILICDANKEPNPNVLNFIFKSIEPKLISASGDSRSANNLVRASYVTYSGLLLSKYGSATLDGFMILLERLCYCLDGLERAEVRTARSSLVFGMMSLLPQKLYKKMVAWIMKLAGTSKLSHRQIAVELLSNLLTNDPEVLTQSNEASNNESPDNSNDEPTSDKTDEQEEPQSKKSRTSDEQATDDQNINTEDESSEHSQVPPINVDNELSAEEVSGLLRQRPHTVPFAEILCTLYDRAKDDPSSSIRTRAMNILTECLDNKREAMRQAVKMLAGSGSVSHLMLLSANGVCDERSAVRRAAATLLQRLLAGRHAHPPEPEHLAILVGLSRDATMTVRSAVITLLGELVTLRPSVVVIDAFLEGPMHQLSDPETKVQELVASQVQQLLINRIRKFDSEVNGDPLPWMILAGVIRLNIRRHLQKACLMLSKSADCINHRLVDILSTHLCALDDDHDLQTLVLLTCLARYVEYSDLGFVLDYYYKLAEDSKDHDVRLMVLTLELLSLWARFIGAPERTALRDYLVRRLADSFDDGCRIMTARLTYQLDSENLVWATELMQLSERRAIKCSDIDEAIRAADLSLVAPVPPSRALVQLFINCLNDPPSDWEVSQHGGCVAGAARLCMRSRSTGALVAPPLAALLTRTHLPLPVRTNALVALTDICVRYTGIVEPLLGPVCDCMSTQAPAELRRKAVESITRLLLGGYLRLRTPLYYRYCALLADQDNNVRELAEYYITSCLKNDTIFNHFVDCLLHYNKDESENLSFDARQLIYDVMLQRMTLGQKVNTQCKLAQEVLEHAANLADEGHEELPPEINGALLDTITVLCGVRMRLPRKPSSGDTHDIDDLQERVRTNIMSHKMKRTVAEVLVPAVMRLHSRLGSRGGQVAAYLVRLATDLLTDYRHEIEELYDNDEDLVVRVKKFQETFGLECTTGNVRNLVTNTAPPEPETPRSTRRRPRNQATTPRKRTLHI